MRPLGAAQAAAHATAGFAGRAAEVAPMVRPEPVQLNQTPEPHACLSRQTRGRPVMRSATGELGRLWPNIVEKLALRRVARCAVRREVGRRAGGDFRCAFGAGLRELVRVPVDRVRRDGAVAHGWVGHLLPRAQGDCRRGEDGGCSFSRRGCFAAWVSLQPPGRSSFAAVGRQRALAVQARSWHRPGPCAGSWRLGSGEVCVRVCESAVEAVQGAGGCGGRCSRVGSGVAQLGGVGIGCCRLPACPPAGAGRALGGARACRKSAVVEAAPALGWLGVGGRALARVPLTMHGRRWRGPVQGSRRGTCGAGGEVQEAARVCMRAAGGRSAG